MNDISGNGIWTTGSSMKDVRLHIENSPDLSEATRTDYLAQINRCVSVFNVNDLADVSASITSFQSGYKKTDYPFEHFKTVKSYLAWRKKMISILKRASGIAAVDRERRDRRDDWADLLDRWKILNLGENRSLISISLLADEARKVGRTPKDLDLEWLIELMDNLSTGRRRGIPRAIQLLEAARQVSSEIDAMFKPGCLPNPKTVRRAPPIELPAHINDQAIDLVDEHCRGEYDEILDESTDAKAPATVASYRAALKKYLASAWASGALPHDCKNLADAFEKHVFLSVLRDWINETDEVRQISDRTKRSYVGNIMSLAIRLGLPVDFMATALTVNRNMKNGRVEANTMSLDTRAFCARLLQHRKVEMTFRSLHLRFQEQALALMAAPTAPFADFRIIQFGVLAAFSAIALWGVPLRIDNMRCLRHRGENPTLVLPEGARKQAHILLPAMEVKNRKPIKAHIAHGPTRAVEILEWYLDEIRPHLPWAKRSNFLFPGYSQEIISRTALRNWLQDHSRDLDIPMDPHNFRHGLASLYLRDHPGEYSQAARLLCNTPGVVRRHYAWIDEEAEMRTVQKEVARLGGFNIG